MGLFKKQRQGSRHVLLLLIINLVCWFFDIALAQADVFAKAFESLDFPIEAITCLVNILVFITTLLRGRFDLENGAREVLAILTAPKLKNGNVLTACTEEESGEQGLEKASVVMLSNGRPNWSMKQFMRSNAHIHNVNSVLLEFTTPEENSCACRDQCNCIVFLAVEGITGRIPETLTRPNDQRLLPCRTCLRRGCHSESRADQDQVEEGQRLRDRSVVYDILDDIRARSISTGEPIGICIPLNDAGHDNWTKLLVRSFRSKDEESRGVTVMASEALEKYLDGNGGGGSREEVYYGIPSFIGPRLSEILINLLLTFWFTVDGFSSSFVARRTIRDYLVDSKGNGLAANAFLTKATVKFNAHQVCQVLTFRGNCFSVRTLSFIAAGANLICLIGWGVLIAFEGGDSAPPLSTARVVVIIAAIGIALIIDCLYVYSKLVFFAEKPDCRVLVIILEVVCVVAGSVVVRIAGINVFGEWIYGALQGLVWVKWGIGSYILEKHRREEFGSQCRVLVFSSAFLLNAAFAGVRTKWRPTWPWQDNYLFSKRGKH